MLSVSPLHQRGVGWSCKRKKLSFIGTLSVFVCCIVSFSCWFPNIYICVYVCIYISVYMYIYGCICDIYIYYPLYTNWPITNTDLPHVIIQYILYFICQKLYWTVSGQLSNIGYIGQFQNEATGTLRTRYRRTKAMSMYLMKILSIFLHLRKILICFCTGWFL